jgi:predicted transposase
VLNRNYEVKLTGLEPREEALLDETFEQFRHAAQHAANYGWDGNPSKIIDSKSKLHDATYEDIREETDLTANHVQAARSLAAEALDSCTELHFEEGQEINRPTFRGSGSRKPAPGYAYQIR